MGMVFHKPSMAEGLSGEFLKEFLALAVRSKKLFLKLRSEPLNS